MNICDYIHRLRTDRNWSMRELADKSGLTTGMIHRIESGKADPSLNNLTRIARAFDKDVHELFEEATHFKPFLVPLGDELGYQFMDVQGRLSTIFTMKFIDGQPELLCLLELRLTPLMAGELARIIQYYSKHGRLP